MNNQEGNIHDRKNATLSSALMRIKELILYPNLVFLLGLAVIALPYLIWEIYWAKQVSYQFMKWHTHLALYFYCWLICYLLLYFFNRFFSFKNYSAYQMTLFSVSLTLVLAEGLLVATGIGDTYSEHIGYPYFSNYRSSAESYYRNHLPSEKFEIARPEFKYPRLCNSNGYSDIEWTMPKKQNEKRIACFGDSFTEGVGAPFDSCYVSILRNLLQEADTNLTVMNAGISGDDPCVNFVSYRDHLAPFKPDIIVQTLSSNDMNTDIATKGGLERFQKDGTVKFQSGPWWEPIFALSYVARTFFHALGYNELLLRVPISKKDQEYLNGKTMEAFSIYAAEAKKNGALLLVVLQPDQSAVYEKKYEYDLSPVVSHLMHLENVRVYDLIPFYLHEFSNTGNNVQEYYWKQDGHHNAKGYSLMARGIMHGLDSLCIK